MPRKNSPKLLVGRNFDALFFSSIQRYSRVAFCSCVRPSILKSEPSYAWSMAYANKLRYNYQHNCCVLCAVLVFFFMRIKDKGVRVWKSNTLWTPNAFFGTLRATATVRATVLSRVGLRALFKSRNALICKFPFAGSVQNICMNETLRGGSTQGCNNTTVRDVVLEGWGCGVCLQDDRRFFFIRALQTVN